jgi:carbon-monoxide dehydrogenase medium subunit
MFPASFEYHRATAVSEAVELLRGHPGAKLLAGGHSLIPMMKLRLAQPSAVIDIGRIARLQVIDRTGETIRVGSLATHAEIHGSELLRAHCPLLSEAAGKIGDLQVRNFGTLGGNIAHADPASDLPAVLVALGATVHLEGPDGARSVAAGDFFVDLLTTAMGPGEILTFVEVPVLPERTGSAYVKFEHPASGYAVCGAAAVVAFDKVGTCKAASLAFNGVAATPVHATAVTGALIGEGGLAGIIDSLVGTHLVDHAIDAAIDRHLTVTDPLGDTFASGEYRVELAKAYGRRALKVARDRARG